MKNIYLLFFILVFIKLSAQETKKVLFLGNSYTYGNNLPGLVESLATANGDILIKDQNTPGGYTFNAHSTNATSLNKIAADNWDYVVLQAQSQEPSFPPGQVANQTKPFAKILCDSVYANNLCSKPLFFMTWGRENGDQSNCANYAPLCTYEGMQQRLRESYLEMTIENNASCAPVGMAWKKVRADYPSIDLYTADESHPNINGSYLAACVFYSSIFHKSSVGNTFTSTLDSLTAFRLQTIASNTVLDSLDLWQIDTAANVPNITDSLIRACNSIDINGITFTSDTTFSDTNSGNFCEAEVINYEIAIIEDVILTKFEQIQAASYNEVNMSLEAENYDSIFVYIEDTAHLISNSISFNYNNFVYLCNEASLDSLKIKVVISNSCGVDSIVSSCICDFTSQINKVSNVTWQIYPNPTNEFIEIISLNIENFVSSIIDLTGREIISKTEEQRIDMRNLDKGIYILQLYNETGKIIGQWKIIKN